MQDYVCETRTIFPINWHLISVLTTPHYIRLGKSFRFALQCHICAFPHNHIVTCYRFNNHRWNCKESQVIAGAVVKKAYTKCFRQFTDNLKIALPRSHGICVHLTHVPSSIRLLDFSYVQIPATMIVVCEHYSRILCYDIVMNAQNCLSVDSNPRNLYDKCITDNVRFIIDFKSNWVENKIISQF
jgi:hypothetical protein